MLKEAANPLTGNDRFEGYGIDLIHELSLLLGFNYTFKLQEDGNYGTKDLVTGEWNGMLREIMDGVRIYKTNKNKNISATINKIYTPR